MSRWRSTAAERGRDRTVLDDVVRDIGCQRVRRVIVNQAVIDREGWDDPAIAAGSTVRWKLLVDGDRGPSGGLVTGVAEIAPCGVLPRHHHEPEETYYVLSGRGVVEIDDTRTEIGSGTAVFIPPPPSTPCTASGPSRWSSSSPSLATASRMYHFDAA